MGREETLPKPKWLWLAAGAATNAAVAQEREQHHAQNKKT